MGEYFFERDFANELLDLFFMDGRSNDKFFICTN